MADRHYRNGHRWPWGPGECPGWPWCHTDTAQLERSADEYERVAAEMGDEWLAGVVRDLRDEIARRK